MKEYNCVVCGKIVIPTPMWVYKIKENQKSCFCCSYSCYKKAERGNIEMNKRCSNCKKYPFCYDAKQPSGFCDKWEQMKER